MAEPDVGAYTTDVPNTGVSVAYTPGRRKDETVPYSSNADLPSATNGLPAHAKDIYRAAFNSAYEQYKDESRAHATAWAAVKRSYEKDTNGKWHAKRAAFHRLALAKRGEGLWIGHALPPGLAELLAQPDGESADSLHLTVAYVPRSETGFAPDTPAMIQGLLAAIGANTEPVTGTLGSVAHFAASESSDNQDVQVALVDSPGLHDLHWHVLNALAGLGMAPSMAHGYTPHITLRYAVPGSLTTLPSLPRQPISINSLEARLGTQAFHTVTLGEVLKMQSITHVDDMRVLKVDEPERYSLGIVYEPNEEDTQGDFAREEVIRQACFAFTKSMQHGAHLTKQVVAVLEALRTAFVKGGDIRVDITELLAVAKDFRGVGDMHESWDPSHGDIVENYCAPTQMLVGGQIVKRGTWLQGHIWSPEMFTKIQRGERTGLSMGGWGSGHHRESITAALTAAAA